MKKNYYLIISRALADEALPVYGTGENVRDWLRISDHCEVIDPTKFETELGWKPKYNFDTGIQQTIQWYLDNEDWWKHILSGEYSDYFDNMYGNRLGMDLK